MRGKYLLFLEEHKKKNRTRFSMRSLVRFSCPWLKILYILARENPLLEVWECQNNISCSLFHTLFLCTSIWYNILVWDRRGVRAALLLSCFLCIGCIRQKGVTVLQKRKAEIPMLAEEKSRRYTFWETKYRINSEEEY